MKRIILLSDGTGNAAASIWKTNVWRVFESLDLRAPDQVAFYDDGVGTSSFKPLAILGGAFGYGLKRNVLALYKFLCRNYETDQHEIFCFGFSRGAFTIRVVVGLVASRGLVKYTTEAELDQKVRAAYRAYRAEKFKTKFRIERIFRKVRNIFASATHDKTERPVPSIRFLGLWDTVAAYGLPIDEMTRGISKYLFPLELPDRQLDPKVVRACHALSLDDERTTFHPVLWDESNEPTLAPSGAGTAQISQERLSQVWFAGVHSNVGGGYPDDSLAHVSLNWILAEAQACGLRFKQAPSADPDALIHAQAAQDKDGRLYDSRSGLGGYYRYGPRKLADLCDMAFSADPKDHVRIRMPKIHESVLDRIKMHAHLYAPIVLPQTYDLVTYNGTILAPTHNTYESLKSAELRAKEQETVWSLVWQRRVIYFLTVFTSIYLASYPFYHKISKTWEFETPLRQVSDTLRILKSFLPDAISPWIDTYAREPGWFLLTALLISLLVVTSSRLGQKITDEMRAIWWKALTIPGTRSTPRARFAVDRALWCLLVIISIYAIMFPWLPSIPSLPNALTGNEWIAYYSASPVQLILAVFVIALLLPNSWIYSLRSSRIYQASLRWIKLSAAPAFFALAFVYIFLAFGNHLAFTAEDSVGWVCTEHPHPTELRFCGQPTIGRCDNDGQLFCQHPKAKPTCQLGSPACSPGGVAMCAGTPLSPSVPAVCPRPCGDDVVTATFDTRDICHATGIRVEQWGSYRLTVTPDQNRWYAFGGMIGTNAGGFRITDLTDPLKKLVMLLLWPMKRDYLRPWFAVIARVGSAGNDEDFLDPDENTTSQKVILDESRFKPRRDGEVFLYVNDVAVAGGWTRKLLPFFYEKNQGSATVRIERIPNR